MSSKVFLPDPPLEVFKSKDGKSSEIRQPTPKELVIRKLKAEVPPFATREEAMRVAWWLAAAGLEEVAEDLLKRWPENSHHDLYKWFMGYSVNMNAGP